MLSALLLLALQEPTPDALTDALCRKLEGARSLRVEEDMVAVGEHPQGNFRARLTTLLKGADRWATEFRLLEGGDPAVRCIRTRCDGRRMRIDAPETLQMAGLKPETVALLLRRQFATGVLPAPLLSAGADGSRFKREVSAARDEGRDRIDGVEVRILARDVRTTWDTEPFAETVRLHLDPRALRPLRVEGRGDATSWTSTIRVFELDAPLDDGLFALQTPGDLDRAIAGQAARAASLFARFTGRHPRAPEELIRRPADLPAETWFPEGGFTLDGRAPDAAFKDGAATRGQESFPFEAATGRAVGAPTERLRRHYEARVRLHLLAAAVDAYREATGAWPRKAADLWTAAPPWLPGGKLPDDPWGRPLRLVTEKDRVRAQVQDPKERRLPLKGLTAEEKAALEAAARPRPTEDDRRSIPALLDRAVDDDLETREAARRALKARGPATLPFLEERLKAPRDADAARWLQEVRAEFPQAPPAWQSELAALSMNVGSRRAPGGPPDASEAAAAMSLKTIASAQADFRGNDRDENKIQDFWTGDIAGLYAVKTADGQMIKLIELSVAAADAAPLEAAGPWAKLEPREPKGGYLFQAMTLDRSSDPPEVYRQDTEGVRKMGKVFNHSKFGACAFPADYGVGGTRTFILNESNTVFWKDSEGEPVLEWPSDEELRRDWKKLD